MRSPDLGAVFADFSIGTGAGMMFANLLQLDLLLALLSGLLLGSFLNVVIHRLPRMLEHGDAVGFNLAWPQSHCPRCRCPLRWWHTLPLLGYMLLRGRCAHCNQPISWRYPLVEGAMALCCLLFTWQSLPPAILIGTIVLSAALLALSLIDLETGLLPDSLTLTLLWAGLLFNLQQSLTPLPHAVLGAVVGYLFPWLVYWVYRLLTGREGLGYGDMKLLAALGAWLGWMPLAQVLLLSSLTGLLAGGILMLYGRLARHDPMPFGPFLAASGWLVWVAHVCF